MRRFLGRTARAVRASRAESLAIHFKLDPVGFLSKEYSTAALDKVAKGLPSNRIKFFEEAERKYSITAAAMATADAADIVEGAAADSGDKKDEESIREAVRDLDIFRGSLSFRLRALDEKYWDGSRQKVISAYYNTYLKMEEDLIGNDSIKPFASVSEADVSIYCIESTDDHETKGTAVIAKKGEKVVGRMFMAHPPTEHKDHLTILSASGNSIDQRDLAANMVTSYFNFKMKKLGKDDSLTKIIHTSCVGNYDYLLSRLGRDFRTNRLVDLRGKAQLYFSAEYFYNQALSVIEPAKSTKPDSKETKPALVKPSKFIERE